MRLIIARSLRRWLLVALGLVGVVSLAVSSFGEFYFFVDSDLTDSDWRRLHILNRLDLAERYEQGLFFLCSGLLWCICLRRTPGEEKMRRYWWTLTGIFSFIFLIKIFPIYSYLVQGIRHFDAVAGRYFSALALCGFSLGLALGFGAYFIRFLAGLRPRLRQAFVVGGLFFLVGEIVLDGASEWLWGIYGGESLPYLVTDLCERGVEMIGLFVFLIGLLIRWDELAELTPA